MKEFFLVCEYNPEILKLLKGYSVVFYSNYFSILNSLKNDVKANNIHIHSVAIKTNTSLADIIFEEKWNEYPLAIESLSLGRVYEFLVKTPVVRKLNIRFYLSTKESTCYKDVRILSSLGYPSSVIIEGERTDWKQLTDLMTYAFFNARKHAEIHPFNYISNYYNPNNRTNFNSVYFNDPERYLHINEKGNIFLNREDMLSNQNAVADLDSLHSIKELEAYINNKDKWFEFFLEPTRCASCKGWRICLGKYAKYLDSNPGCDTFFSEFIDSIEKEKTIREKRNQQLVLWQP